MPWVVVDVEADGPCPGIYSMVSFGAVVVQPSLSNTFRGFTAPISANWDEGALSICSISRAVHETFPDPELTMGQFNRWIESLPRDGALTFVSDNPAFDWQFINYYFHVFCGTNPFGFSARRIGDLYAGFKGDARRSAECETGTHTLYRQSMKWGHTLFIDKQLIEYR